MQTLQVVACRALAAAVMFGAIAYASKQNCSNTDYPESLDKLVLNGNDELAAKNTTAQACLQLCCQQSNCTAWQFHVSSTDPTHHPLECWLSAMSSPSVSPASPVDVWVGGSKGPVSPGYTRGGGSIQSMSSWFYYESTASDTLLRELTDQSVAFLAERSANVSLLRTRQQWNERVKTTKKALEQVFAPLPPVQRTPPTYKVVDTLVRPTYTCQKILYESRPGFYVTGALWVPKNLSGGEVRPGILLVSGHTPDGFRSNSMNGPVRQNAPADDDYEVVEINLVARGFVVLAFDPIGQGERMQFADIAEGEPSPDAPWSKGASGSTLWGSTLQHEFIGRQLLLNGVGLMSFWLHDEVVSLDLLESLPFVNADALGVVGCSGGGTQSSYLAAMDPRVKAASMACYMSTFEIDRLWKAGGASDGEQTWPHGIRLGLDKSDLIEVRANASTQVLITADDTCFPAAGGWAAVDEARPAYSALGGSLEVYTAVWHHGWVLPTRERISGYFCDEFASTKYGYSLCTNKSTDEIVVSAANPGFEEWNDNDLKITSTGQVVTAPECGYKPDPSGGDNHVPAVTVHNFTVQITQNNMQSVQHMRQSMGAAKFLQHVQSTAVSLSGYVAPLPLHPAFSVQPPAAGGLPVAKPPRFLGAQFVTPHPPGRWHPDNPPLEQDSTATTSIGLVERWMVHGEGSCFITVTLFFPATVSDLMTPRQPMDAVVWYQTATVSASAPPAAAVNLTAQGYIAVFAELCGFGESGSAFSPTLQGNGQAAEDMAHELGRSIPGIHAGDIVRVHRYLTQQRTDVRNIDVAVAQDYLDVALVHATLADMAHAPKHIALLKPRAALASAAMERLYQPTAYYAWIYGILAQYDLPDAVAAAAMGTPATRVLIVGPVHGASLQALSASDATTAYAFATRATAARPSALTVLPGNFSDSNSELSALLYWLQHAD
eukprot:m.1149850 g.1149850  ORF g.1149850 m.1149850 type:complete len:945 (-) comp24476_c0_seq75:328-3162(-)